MTDKVFRFKEWDCIVKKEYFQANNQLCLMLVAADTPHNEGEGVFPFEPIAKASVCVPEYHIEEQQTFIKDFSENKGLLNVLVKEGIVEETGVALDMGFVKNGAHLVNILNV